MRVLLITNNVGRLFDARDDSLIWWINVLDDTITAAAADFVAIHLQKLAGNGVAQLADAVRSRFHDYWCSGLFCPSASDPDFTALGCIVLVRRSLARDVAVFDFSAGQSGGWKPITTLDEPLVPHPALSERWCRHSTFPRHMFDVLDPQWTRKGWLHTRWRVDGLPLDLLNIHLFRDMDHLHALRRSGDMSAYALGRHEALRHALEMVIGSGPAPAALGPLPPSLFVFGDFNFRLDLHSVLTVLAGEQELSDALEQAGSSYTEAVHVRAPAASTPGDFCGALCSCLGFGGHHQIVVDPRRFLMDDTANVFQRNYSAWRECDLEIKACERLHPALKEVEADFPPTWYQSNACPSWCDRVLLDAAAERLLRRATDVSYESQEPRDEDGFVRNTHSMVHFAFTLDPSLANGGSPIGVKVKAQTSPPVPIKVKYVAVGAE